jgi:hypothetical protein
MRKNFYRLWVALLALSSTIALWFSAIALNNLFNFALLNAETPAQITQWQVREISSSRFAIEADYTFQVHGVPYQGKTKFEDPQFLNRYAAETHIRVMDSKSWKTWYRDSNPTRCNLEKEFPKKSCLQALLTVGVCAYFFLSRNLTLRISNA